MKFGNYAVLSFATGTIQFCAQQGNHSATDKSCTVGGQPPVPQAAHILFVGNRLIEGGIKG